MSNYSGFFWLHVKKAAGTTTRRLLQPYYAEVDRRKKPKTFVQASRAEYNDILNNYRVPLGDYQFKRVLFAKSFLYPNEWDTLFSFAFSRNPIDRCVSMFSGSFLRKYWDQQPWHRRLRATSAQWLRRLSRASGDRSYAFDVFLDLAERARSSDSIYYPLGNWFTTHTAPMWDDVTDHQGQVLLSTVFRLENLRKGVETALDLCGFDASVVTREVRLNVSPQKRSYVPGVKQVRKIRKIYDKDFDLYEVAE